MLTVLAWIAYRISASPVFSACLICAGVGIALVYYLIPTTQLALIAGFEKLTFPIRWLMTLITLALVYYCVMAPIAIWYRASGKSIRKHDPDASSSWEPIELPSDPDSYFRTF